MSVRGRCLFTWCLLAIMAAMQGGCTIGGKSFTMDSNSRIPFFGLELKERKPKSSAPAYQSIARTFDTATDVKVALQISPATGKLTKKRVDHPTPLSFSEIEVSRAPVPVGRPKWSAESPASEDVAAESIPLPRTDDHARGADRRAAHPDVDFQ